jgi:hypothetical protein
LFVSIFGKCHISSFLGMDTNATDSTSDTKKRKEVPDDNETKSEQPKRKKAKLSSTTATTTTTAPASAAAATTEPEKKSARLDLLLISGDDDYGALSIENTITAEGAYRLALEQGGSVRKWPLKYRGKPKKKKKDEEKKKQKKTGKSTKEAGESSESDSERECLDGCYASICETFTFSDERNRREAFNAVTTAIENAQDYDYSKHSNVIPFERDGDQLESYEEEEDESEGDQGE